MTRRDPQPAYVMRQRVDITLNASEVEHAIRCWLLNHAHLPQAKSFSDIAVRVSATDEGQAIDATMIYEPQAPAPAKDTPA